jgi:hypothetical protein
MRFLMALAGAVLAAIGVVMGSIPIILTGVLLAAAPEPHPQASRRWQTLRLGR